MENKLPTLKEIARILKVSVSTVSRALNNHSRIGLNTRLKVQQLAKELNFEPNAKAVSFKQRKSFVIGVVLPYIKEEFFSLAISGIETAAILNDYTILFGQSYDDMEKEKKVVAAMKRQRVDGLLISLAKNTVEFDHLDALDKYNIPVVYFDRVPQFKKAHKVYCNLYQGTIDIVDWLFNKGCRRIAFINGPAEMQASKDRLNGYIEGVFRHKQKVDMQLVETTDFSKEATYAAVKKLLALKKPPSAIISFNDYVHMDAVQYALSINVRINEDVLFVSYANLPITSYIAYPPMVSIEQYPYKQGEKAMQLLMNILQDKPSNPDAVQQYVNEELHPALISHFAS